MADTVRRQEQKIEYFDPPEVLQEKVQIVANLILKSKHFIAFTGAGISTSCGIPDFRSGMDTVLKTGAGVWQKRANNVAQTPNPNIVDRNKALPSFTHMSLVTLQKAKILKFLVSQNTDGLHLRSGFNTYNFAQLHGNRMLQKCKNCDSKFLRDFITRQAKKAFDHQTSRKCEKCGNKLYDSIINFGQSLPQYELNRSLGQGDKADVCLAMGSSLTVNPAAHIPKTVGKNGNLIIVNLQKTPLDSLAQVKVNAMCDDFMKLLMKRLQIQVEPFVLSRLLEFKINKNKQLQFRGVDKRGIPFTYLKQVDVIYTKDEIQIKQNLGSKQPFIISLQKAFQLKINLEFYGWLKQPPVIIHLDKQREGVIQLLYDPLVGQWNKPIWLQNFGQNKL